MSPRLVRAAAAVALLIAAVPSFAGSVERFLLPRMKSATVVALAPTPTHAWAISFGGDALAKVGLDGTVLDVSQVFTYMQRMVIDPVDNSLWSANYFSVSHHSLTGQLTTHSLSLSDAGSLVDVIFGPDGNLWLTMEHGLLLRVSRTGQVTQFPGFGGAATRLAAGPDGNIWITDSSLRTVNRVTPSGTRTIFPLPQLQGDEQPNAIAAGADGNLWFVTSAHNIYRMNTSGAVTGSFHEQASGTFIVAGADGNLWTSDGFSVARFEPATESVSWRYTPPSGTDYLRSLSASATHVWWGSQGHGIGSISYDLDVVAAPFLLYGPDPYASASSSTHIWFTAPDENTIGRFDPADGSTALFTLPHPYSKPLDIVAGPDAMWFTEESGDRIGRIDGNGVLQEFAVPTPGKKPTAITYGADGNFWFTLFAGDSIVRLTPAGAFTEFPLAQAGCGPNSIAPGADGNLWITCKTSAKVLRVTHGGIVTGTFSVDGTEPGAIIGAPDGNLWFSTSDHHFRLTTAGAMTKFEWPNASEALERVIGPDGVLWDANHGGIVRTTLDGISNHHFFAYSSSGRAIASGPDAKIWFSNSNVEAWYRFTPDAPIVGTGRTLCYTGDNRINHQVVATFVDPDPTRPQQAYSAFIWWEDGVRDVWTDIIPTGTPGEFAIRAAHYYGSASLPHTAMIVLKASGDETHLGQTITILSPVPPFSVTTSDTWFPPEGGSGTIQISADAACPWQAEAADYWITFPNGTSGQGSGSLTFDVAPYTPYGHGTSVIRVGGAAVTITQSAAPDPASRLYVMTPCRIVDTRYGRGPLPSGTVVRHYPPSSCGIPSDAQAIVANVTVITPPASGWLSLYPGTEDWPNVSTVNYRAGRTRANNVLLKVDQGFNVMNSGATVHYVIDAMGYFK